MGVFVNIIESNKTYIPEGVTEEYVKRIEELFQASGMMDFEIIYISDDMEILDEKDIQWDDFGEYCGKMLLLMKKAKMDTRGMDFTYNYFEDTSHENAGFSLRGRHVTSNKTGSAEFCKGVMAAYFLEQQYMKGISFIECEGNLEMGYSFIGWLNYLFEEKYIQKNRDAWKLYEVAHYSDEYGYGYTENMIDRDGSDAVRYDGDILGYIEMRVVTDKTSEMETIKKYRQRYKLDGMGIGDFFDTFFDSLDDMLCELRDHKETNMDESDVDEMLNLLKAFYGSDISTEDFLKMCNEKGLEKFGIFTYRYDFPAYAVKAASENYDKDFWELWDYIRWDVNGSKREFPEIMDSAEPETPISTQDFFEVSEDDMIPYWTDDGDIEFSMELKRWFMELRTRYNAIYETTKVNRRKNYKKWIVGIMYYANWEYYRIYTFENFFYETMDNLYDRRYIALWKLYEELLLDPELEKAGSVIFRTEDEKKDKGILDLYDDDRTRRHLKTYYWDSLPNDEKFNKARITFRRYMALVANKELRNKVFGF